MNMVVNLISNDGGVFFLDMNAIKMSTTLKTMFDTLGDKENEIIHLEKFNSSILRLIVSWMNCHVNDPHPEDVRIEGFKDNYYSLELCDDDKELLKDCSTYTLFQLSLAAHYLDVKGLLTFASKGIANCLTGKIVLELKKEMGAWVQRLHINVTEEMSGQERETIERMIAVEDMQADMEEFLGLEPTDCLRVDDQLKCKKMDTTEEEIEWQKKVREMQVYIDESIEFDPIECQRMAELLRSCETNDNLEREREDISVEEREISVEEREEIEWRNEVEAMQIYIDEIVEFQPRAG